jgi:hypothetical protein
MTTTEGIILAVAFGLALILFFEFRKLKKRFDIVERMLAWKNILTFDETRWDKLPKEVKEDIKEWNK